MLPVLTRKARPDEAHIFAKWTIANKVNYPDPDVLTYKNTYVRVAFDKDGPLVFMPVQRPIHMESLAIRPGATKGQVAAALRALFQDTINGCIENGSGEIYIVATEESIPKFAKKAGFEILPFKVLRIKIKDLECQPEQTDSNSITQ